MIKSGEGPTVWSRRRMWPVGNAEAETETVSLGQGERRFGKWSVVTMIHVLKVWVHDGYGELRTSLH
jgi:hypothetical protein